MKYQKALCQKGFTLIEILLAVVLLVFGVVAVVGAMSSGLHTDSYVNDKVIALSLAQEKMEEIKNESTFSSIDSYASARTALSSPFTSYDREVLVTDLDDYLKKVIVNVYWQYKSVDQEITLVTLISKATYYEG